MTDPEQDVFEAYLKRRAVLPALDHGRGPPAALDAAVLAKAREAIQPGSATVGDTETSGAGDERNDGLAKPPRSRPPRWAVPMALAATVLLCLSVVMNVSINTNRPRSSATLERMAAARIDSKVSALSNATAESNAAAGVEAPASGAAHDRFANDGQQPESVSGEIASHEVVLPRAKVVGVQAPRPPVEAIAADTAREVAAAPSLAANARGGTTASPPEPANVPGGRADAAGVAADTQRMAAAGNAVMMAKRAGVASPEYTPAPAASRADAQGAARQEAAGQAVTDQQAAVAARPAASKAVDKSESAAQAAGHVTTDSAAAIAPHPADPKVWLQQIEALRAAGKKDQADAEMRRFKVAFPHYSIPAPAPAASDLPK